MEMVGIVEKWIEALVRELGEKVGVFFTSLKKDIKGFFSKV